MIQTLLPFDYFEAFGIFVSETDEVNQSKPSKVERLDERFRRVDMKLSLYALSF